jgi:hypothetical protein
MKLFDSLRPQSDGIPLYAPQGTAPHHALGLPTIYVSAGATEGEWIVGVHMPNSYNAFGGYEARVASNEALAALFVDWLDDPERVIEQTFKYTYNAKANLSRAKGVARERSVAAGLAELGLDDL